MSTCAHIEREQLEGGCYSCVKAASRLLKDLPVNGQGPPTAAQLRWIGLEDEYETGRWNFAGVSVPDLLTLLLQQEEAHPWDRRVPATWSWEKPPA